MRFTPRSEVAEIGACRLPSVVQVMDARHWTRRARCIEEPYASWPWIQEPSGGRDNPRAVAKLMEVCAGCPVRRECLVQALSEHRVTVMGVFGGTTTADRTRTLPLSNRRGHGPRFAAWLRAHERAAQAAADALERSFPRRLELALQEGHDAVGRHKLVMDVRDRRISTRPVA